MQAVELCGHEAVGEVAPDDPRESDTLGWILYKYKRGIYQGALSLLKESAAKIRYNLQVQYPGHNSVRTTRAR